MAISALWEVDHLFGTCFSYNADTLGLVDLQSTLLAFVGFVLVLAIKIILVLTLHAMNGVVFFTRTFCWRTFVGRGREGKREVGREGHREGRGRGSGEGIARGGRGEGRKERIGGEEY